jgi:lipid A 3-O-deacylase
LRRFVAALLASLALGAHAGNPYWYLQFDNDAGLDTDRWYSSGLRLARVSSHGAYDLEWALLQEIYTPEAKRFTLGTVDRAPTSLIMLALARHDPHPLCLQTIELAVGVRGPSALGEEATEFIHRVVSAREVDWTYQERDQLTARLAMTRSHRLEQATLHYGAVVGTDRTFAHAGAEWRFGADLASSMLRYAPTPPPRAGEARWGSFLGIGARVIARDDLMGRSYDLALPPPELERVVGRAVAGVGLVRPWGSVLLTMVLDTREFEEQRVPHRFGSIAVHIDF